MTHLELHNTGGCSCHLSPPCSFCTLLNEEELEIYLREGVHGLAQFISARDDV
jgi:hypothetical protein